MPTLKQIISAESMEPLLFTASPTQARYNLMCINALLMMKYAPGWAENHPIPMFGHRLLAGGFAQLGLGLLVQNNFLAGADSTVRRLAIGALLRLVKVGCFLFFSTSKNTNSTIVLVLLLQPVKVIVLFWSVF